MLHHAGQQALAQPAAAAPLGERKRGAQVEALGVAVAQLVGEVGDQQRQQAGRGGRHQQQHLWGGGGGQDGGGEAVAAERAGRHCSRPAAADTCW